MSQSLVQNFEYTAAHIKDYIDDDKLFTTFEVQDIRKIMKFANLTTNDFNTLLKQSKSIVKANDLYMCIRYANVSIRNHEEVINLLKTAKKYLKLTFLDGTIDFLIQSQTVESYYTEKIQILQAELKTIHEQKQKSNKEIESLQSQLNQIMTEEKVLSKISELKNSNDFYRIYNFFEELSSQGNQRMISKACKEGLWLKEATKSENFMEIGNVLHIACEKGNLNLVKSLIESGCDKEYPSCFKNTPLDHASMKGQLEVVQYLISVGANIEVKSTGGWNPLIYASMKGQLEVVQYLISVGADKEAKTNYGITSLICASDNGHLEVVQYLISVGADKEAKDNKGLTPLIWASDNGHLEVVKYLISVGVDKEAKSKYGETPLIFASQKGHLEVVKYLISVGADKEAKTIYGSTSLICASQKGHLEVVQYLISIGADKEAKDEGGSTPLICASIHGHLDVVKYLISVGADKEAKNKDGKTCYDYGSCNIKDYLSSLK
ncbi:ankyrin repeat protein, putative [Trichomonas vaginalis G3]|uniref:Ankyrin repeat protein, putative n=1 Tax=Trichomonas vaginalis (strain ATCC PRA-98 / G3) TaxID=412133 RepID=A2DG39_TRIV3|nr:ankyrin repeat protein family [Trichomonas vaginalis G3]EAY20666.1 ankyrin repeat protein, putative [Trichomonas vaginalis G3]KAI5487387.1 ankyrin repeat protein family [Trichomonas vaginalis G3]|eukprot:XP_001581652.1 ankyrin repeat protein [Trichomonas vaginalis G3]